MLTPPTLPPPVDARIIPPTAVVKSRLIEAIGLVRLLKQQLKVSESAEMVVAQIPRDEPELEPAPTR